MDGATQTTLLEAARTIARGGELEDELRELAGHAATASGAIAAAIYVLDPVAARLVPAAGRGLDDALISGADTVALDDERELVAKVAREGRAVAGGDGLSASLFDGTDIRAVGLLGIPLVAADESGRQGAEGVIVVAFAGEAPRPNGAEGAAFAVADLCAVAIRKARLASALVQRSEWIERLASTDALTGLANESTFSRMLELEIARATRQETKLSVVLFDIDDLVGINAREGSAAGDHVLRRFASLLAEQVRLVDSIARLGADEFGLLAPGGGGHVAAARIRNAAAGITSPTGAPISVHAASVVFPDEGGSSIELTAAARMALEEARAQGPGSIVSRS